MIRRIEAGAIIQLVDRCEIVHTFFGAELEEPTHATLEPVAELPRAHLLTPREAPAPVAVCALGPGLVLAAVFALGPYVLIALAWWFDYDNHYDWYIDWFRSLTWEGFVERAELGFWLGSGVGTGAWVAGQLE